MYVDRERIYKLLKAAAEDLNTMQPPQSRLDPSETTLLIADGGVLSSLAVVTFILAVEEKLSEVLSKPILLFNESLITDPNGPFRTIGSLVDHIHALIQADSS